MYFRLGTVYSQSEFDSGQVNCQLTVVVHHYFRLHVMHISSAKRRLEMQLLETYARDITFQSKRNHYFQ